MPSPLEAIEHDSAIVFALDRELKIVYCNQAWDRFAESNGGAALKRPTPHGMCVLDVIPEPLKNLYRSAYLNVFARSRQWVYDYECSSATVHRLFRMTALHRPKDEFILVTNFLLEERPHGNERLVMQPNPPSTKDPAIALRCALSAEGPAGGTVGDGIGFQPTKSFPQPTSRIVFAKLAATSWCPADPVFQHTILLRRRSAGHEEVAEVLRRSQTHIVIGSALHDPPILRYVFAPGAQRCSIERID